MALLSSSAESLTGRTTRAAQWRFAGSVIGVAFQFGFGVVLARLLTPRDFGVMALAIVVLGLARLLGDLGMGRAVVQRATLTERHVRTAFTVSVLVGIVTGALIVLMAPLGAAVMREPTLTPMLRVVSISFVMRGVSTVAGALLWRSLDFKRQVFVDIGSYVFGYAGVATSLALLDHGVWSLVFGSLAQTFLATTAQMALVRHSILPLLGGRELRDLLGFAVGATLSGFVNYLALNGDNFVVGRWSGAATLGLYNRAYTLMNMPFTYVAGVMSGALFPALAQVQHQPERMRRAYLLVTQLTALVAGPVMGVMALAAPLLVSTIYGPQWEGSIVPLQILCLAGYFRALYHPGGVLVQSAGHVYSELACQVMYAALVIAGALIGLAYGLPGVAAGVATAIVCMFIATVRLALRVTGTSWRLYLRVQVFAIVIASVTSAVAVAIRWGLQAADATGTVILAGMILGSAVTWALGAAWKLSEPDFASIRDRLPYGCSQTIERLSRWRSRSAGIVVPSKSAK